MHGAAGLPPQASIGWPDGMWIAISPTQGRGLSGLSSCEGTAMLSKLIYGFAAFAAVLALTACNTVNGAGKDIEKGGQKIQDESKEVQHGM
jgi:entericidin B